MSEPETGLPPQADNVPPVPPAEHIRAPYPSTAPAEAPQGRRRLLILLAAALGAFVVVASIGLLLVILTNPVLRGRLTSLTAGQVGPPPESPNKFVAIPDGPVAITDDFSQLSNRWDRSQTRMSGGAYELTLELPHFDTYGLYLGVSDVRDFDMAVDVLPVSGDLTSEFGIRFRQAAPDDHLLFSISPSGYFRLAQVRNETYTSLVPWTADPRIRRGLGVSNRLRVIAEGASIRGFINGEQVLEYTDERQQAGQLTLGLVTFDRGDLTVRFDNIEGAVAPIVDAPRDEWIDLREDFSDSQRARWSVGGAAVVQESYEVFVSGEVVSWQQPLPIGSSRVEGDFVLEVDATMVESSEGRGSGYGVMFGDDAAFNFFALIIFPEGGFMFYRNGADGGLIIPPAPAPAVRAGLNATNRIRVEVRERRLAISVNDEVLAELEFADTVSLDGRAGLVVQGADASGARVRFDNFRLEELP
ncbi:MAG: hypothetical protein ACUVS4_11750 [Chloroflexaceae bacterium]